MLPPKYVVIFSITTLVMILTYTIANYHIVWLDTTALIILIVTTLIYFSKV